MGGTPKSGARHQPHNQHQVQPQGQPRRAGATRQALLAAAREIFGEHGYTAASIAEVVRRADASVGSLYHHFGGKVDLFLALWEDFRANQERVAAEAVALRRQSGESDPVVLFVAGACSYLENCWARRDVAKLFLTGDGPPGFDLLRRQNTREWLRQNAILLRAEERPPGRALVIVLTTTIGEVGREVVRCENDTEARELVDAALVLIDRLCEFPL
ncbi:MAG: TetR/AcrR family transcriptional regulator [Carbonactinosporaceae bacterium]